MEHLLYLMLSFVIVIVSLEHIEKEEWGEFIQDVSIGVCCLLMVYYLFNGQ